MISSPRDLTVETTSIETTLPFQFRHRRVLNPQLLVIFLHGYADHGGSLTRRLFQDWPKSFEHVGILAPNGPFPTPIKTEIGWREAFAWYFYSEAEQKMIIPPDTAIDGCLRLVEKFGYVDVPKVIVGFSQGGFLAPVLAHKLKNVKEVIGVATGFRSEYYPVAHLWHVTAVHGSDDEIFPVNEARSAHAAVLEGSIGGEFIEVPGLTHVASYDVGRAIETRVAAWLSTSFSTSS